MKLGSTLCVALLILLGAAGARAQTRIVTGRVTDSLTAEPVTSGQVAVAGTTVGTQVQGDGTFTVAAPPRDVTITVRSVGFKRKDVAVGLGLCTSRFLSRTPIHGLAERPRTRPRRRSTLATLVGKHDRQSGMFPERVPISKGVE